MDFRLLNPNAAAQGVEKANAWAEMAAKRIAGGRIADGDRQGAQDHLNRSGLLGQAQNMMQQDWAIENRAIEADDRARKLTLEAEKREAETLGTMAEGLSRVMASNGREAVLPAFDTMAKSWLANGATPESIAQMRTALETNPEAFLEATTTASKEALQRYQFNTVGGALVRSDRRTGDVSEMYKGEQYIQADPTKDLVHVPGRGGAGGPSGGPAADAPGAGGSALKAQTAPDAIRELFPGARVTGGDRDPARNRAVGGAERSWHLQAGKAVDMAPIPGETVESVKAKLEAAGWTVHEALDETRRTNGTGPHWHFAASPPANRSPSSPSGPEVIRAARPRETDQWRTMTPQEVAQAGMQPGTSAQVNARTGQTRVAQQPPRGSSGSGTSASGRKLSAQEQVTLKDVGKEATAAQNVRPLLEQMRSLAESIDTGGIFAMPGSATVAGAFDERIRRFQSLTDQMTPLMRNGLPGAASDRDVAMFRSAAPSLDKPRAANLAGIDAGIALANRMGDYKAFLDAYALENGTILGAQEMWARYTNSPQGTIFDQRARGLPRLNRRMIPWRQFFRDGVSMEQNSTPRPAPSPSGGGSPQRRRYNPATGRVE